MPRYRIPPQPYQSGGYDPGYRSGDRILELMMRQGEIQAEGARRSSDIWANAIGSAGSTLAAGAQGWTKRREEKKEKEGIAKQDQAFLELFKDPEKQPTIEDTVRIYGMDRGMAIYKGYSSLQSEKPDLDTVLSGFEAASPEMRAVAWPKARGHLVARGVPQETLPGQDQYDDEWYQRFKKARSGEQPKGVVVPEGGVLLDPQTGTQLGAGVPKVPKGPSVGSFEDYMGADPARKAEIETARKGYGQADDRARITVNAPSGMSPTMEANVINRLSKQWTTSVAPIAELDRQVKLLDVGLDEARKGNMAQGAQTILVTFQKILDPPSVVRESEYMRSASGLALMERVKGAFEKLTKGGAGVPVGELEKFANLARQAAKAQASGYSEAIKDRIGKTADRYKIPRELVFEDFEFTFNGGKGDTGGPKPGDVVDGYKYKGGNPKDASSWEQ